MINIEANSNLLKDFNDLHISIISMKTLPIMYLTYFTASICKQENEKPFLIKVGQFTQLIISNVILIAAGIHRFVEQDVHILFVAVASAL